MADRFHKPFSRARWFRGLHDVTHACAHAQAGDQEKIIRDMRDLLACAPERDALAGLTVPHAARLETLFGTRCWDSAALAMLGDDTGYLLSRSESGRHLASIILPGQFEETICPGNTLALALIGAMASALSEGAIMAYPEHQPKAPRHLN